MTHPFLPHLGRPLVLASRSPRRAELLRRQGLEFEVLPAEVEELRRRGESPPDYAERLGREKALAVAARRPESVCLGSDTIVVLDDEILEQPSGAAEARAMLRRLSGRTHVVMSSVALACAERDYCESRLRLSEVLFRELGDDELDRYVATGEARDKAGSYGIQDIGALLVESIAGDYFAVMGLPLQRLRELWIDFTSSGGTE